MKDEQSLYYSPVYGRLLMALGILFCTIFALGFLIAGMGESVLYLIFTSFMIVVGYYIQRNPYALYGEDFIQMNHYNGRQRERVTFKSKSDVQIKDDRFYVDNKKLKMNKWFIREADWRRMVQFYSDSFDSDSELLA